MIATAGLKLEYLDYTQIAALSQAWWDRVLGCVVYSGEVQPLACGAVIPTHVPMPLLEGGGWLCEVWRGPRAATAGMQAGIHYRDDGEMLFGHLVLDRNANLEEAFAASYGSVLDLLRKRDYSGLLRVWNFIPGINEQELGEERYRQFNRARQRAFATAGVSLEQAVPAACAVGLPAGAAPLMYFIASRAPPQPFENPRQLRASDYPHRYGQHSPVFSRACLSSPDLGSMLFVSGTASIIGHESVHIGDAGRQAAESLLNIDALLGSINESQGAAPIGLQDLAYKVYLRHPRDRPTVNRILRQRLGETPLAVYAQADICREELLVEIEATGRAPRVRTC